MSVVEAIVTGGAPTAGATGFAWSAERGISALTWCVRANKKTFTIPLVEVHDLPVVSFMSGSHRPTHTLHEEHAMYANTAKGFRDEVNADYGTKAKSRKYLRRNNKRSFQQDLRRGEYSY